MQQAAQRRCSSLAPSPIGEIRSTHIGPRAKSSHQPLWLIGTLPTPSPAVRRPGAARVRRHSGGAGGGACAGVPQLELPQAAEPKVAGRGRRTAPCCVNHFNRLGAAGALTERQRLGNHAPDCVPHPKRPRGHAVGARPLALQKRVHTSNPHLTRTGSAFLTPRRTLFPLNIK